MNRDLPPTDEPRPLAAFLFGWAFARPRGRVILIVLAAIGALSIADEIWRGRPAFGLPFEDVPGFYALLGFGAVMVSLIVARLWALVFGAFPAPEDET